MSRIDTDRAWALSPSAWAKVTAAGPMARSASHRNPEGGALHEIEYAEPGREPRAARGRQYVVGPAEIVADRFGRDSGRGRWRRHCAPSPPADRDRRPQVPDAPARSGRQAAQPHRSSAPWITAPCARQLSAAMAVRGSVASGRVDRGHDPPGEGRVVGDEDRLRRRVVLGLGQKIGGDPGGIVVAIGDHQDLGRPGDHIDADGAEHLALGGSDIGVARPHHLVDRTHCLGAIGEGGDRLGAADALDLVDPGQPAAASTSGLSAPSGAGTAMASAVDAGDPGRESRSSAPRTGRRRCPPGT